MGVRAQPNSNLARAGAFSVVSAHHQRILVPERARGRVHKPHSSRCLAPNQAQHQARTPARASSAEVILALSQPAVDCSLVVALPRARRRRKIRRRPAVVASSATRRWRRTNSPSLNRSHSRRPVEAASLAAARRRGRGRRRTSHSPVGVSLVVAGRRGRPQLLGKQAAWEPNLRRRVVCLVPVLPRVRVRVRPGWGRRASSADNSNRRRAGYSETQGRAPPRCLRAVCSETRQPRRRSSRQLAVDCSAIPLQQLSNRPPQQVVDFSEAPLLKCSPPQAVGCSGARPHRSSQLLQVDSLPPPQHSRANNLDGALFLVRRRRRVQVYLRE